MASTRREVWKEAFLQPVVWVVDGLYALINLFIFIRDNLSLSAQWKARLELPHLVGKVPWWGWLVGVFFVNLVAMGEGAFRAVRKREVEIANANRRTQETEQRLYDGTAVRV